MKYIIFGMLFVITGNIPIYSQTDTTEFRFVTEDRIDVCDKTLSKDLLLVLNIGEIFKDDGLEVISFQIEYDIRSVKFDFVLTTNTLLDQFEYKNYSISNSEGVIVIDAGNNTIGETVFGNKPLLALTGKTKADECEVDSKIKVSRVLFNDEYKKQAVLAEPFYLPNSIDKGKAGKYNIKPEKDTLFFDSLTTNSNLKLEVQTSDKFSYMLLKYPKQIGTYTVGELVIENNSLILAKEELKDSVLVKITNLNDVRNFDLNFEIIKTKNDTNSYSFKIDNIEFEHCNCNLNSNISPIIISQIKYNEDDSDTTVSVYRGKQVIYSIDKNIIQIDNTNLELKLVKIWDTLGQELYTLNINNLTGLSLDLQQFNNKVLIAQFIYKDFSYNTTKLILQ